MRELPSSGRRVSNPAMEDRLLDMGASLYAIEKALAHIPEPEEPPMETTTDA